MNLKKTILILFVGALTVAGCKKSKSVTPEVAPDPIPTTLSFDQLTYAKIAAQDKDGKFTSANIVATTAAAGNVLKPGAIILYKTNLGNYGKLKVVSIDANYLLTIDIITYGMYDGELANKKALTLAEFSFPCDLDAGQPTVNAEKGDFLWTTTTKPETNLTSKNGAIFYLYSK